MEQGIEATKMKSLDFSDLVHHLSKEQYWDTSRLIINTSQNVFVNGNPELLGRLITNLVENAFKYSPKNSPVHLNISSNTKEACLSVQDQGIGISKEDQQKIWNRFYQADTSRGNDEGSGLGLSMVKQIAELHGGFMTLDSSPGCGSTFTLHLPLLKKN